MLKLNGNISLALGSGVSNKAYLGNVLVYDKTAPIVIEPELQAAIDRIALNGWNTYPEYQKNVLNTWIKSTKSNGNVWNNAKIIRVASLNDVSLLQASLINLKDPNGELATVHGGVTYTVNGYKFGGVTGYIDDKFNPTALGLSIGNLGLMYDLMDDFSAGLKFFGAEINSPTRRLSFYVNENPSGDTRRSYMYVNDVSSSAIVTIASNRTMYFGRFGDIKSLQINNTRSTFAAPAIAPLIDMNLYSGAMNYRSAGANYFCDGTERLLILGKSNTEAEINQQIIINNKLYTDFGLPINS